MISVCEKHVSEGIKMLRVPHIKKTTHETVCLFCKHSALFEIYYFKHSFKRYIKPNQREAMMK